MSDSKVLAADVHVSDERHRRHIFAAGSTPPAWAAKQITNPKAWVDAPAPDQVDVPENVDEQTTGRGAGAGEGGPESEEHSDPDRPRGNASREEWAAYATGLGVDVTGTMGQRDIRTAVDAKLAEQS